MWNPTKAEATTDVAEGISNRKKTEESEECNCSYYLAECAGNSGCLADKSLADKSNCKIMQNKLSNNSKEDQKHFGKEAAAQDEEAIDSGFISGLTTCSSVSLTEENNIIGPEIKQSPQQQQEKQQQQESKTFLDSGCIEAEDFDDENDDDEGNKVDASATISGDPAEIDVAITKSQSEAQVQNELHHKIITVDSSATINQNKKSNLDKMRFKNNIDSGITERFCSLSLQSGGGSGVGVAINNLNVNSTRRHSNIESALTENNNSTNNNYINNNQTIRQQSLPSSTTTTQQQQQLKNKSRLNDWEEFYQQNSDGDTPLHLACLAGAEDVVGALLRMAIHPCLYNIQNDDAQTPLHMAALSANPKIIRTLLLMGAESTVRDRHGNTALHLAVNSGEEQCVRALLMPIGSAEVQEALRSYAPRLADKKFYTTNLIRLPMDLEICNYNGERCVHLAAQEGHINILRQLVSCGANINAREGKSGRTPLHIAIENCNEGVVNFLLDECHNELNLETATYAGLTAYQVACLLDKEQLLCILEKRGAEPLTPPESDYEVSDGEDIDDSKVFGDPCYFISYNGPNVMRVA